MANAVAVLGQSSFARAFQVSVPALRNTRAIKDGEPIALKWSKPKGLAKEKKEKVQTWMTAIKKQKLR